MLGAVVAAITLPCFAIVRAATNNERPSQTPQSSQRHKSRNASGFGDKKKDPVWQCVQKCGACCKLDKGPCFSTPDESSTILLMSSCSKAWLVQMGGADTMTRVQENVPFMQIVHISAELSQSFLMLYGIDHRKFNKEACSCCIDTIKAVYGTNSEELERLNHAIWIDRTER